MEQIVALVTSSKKLVVRLWGRLHGCISHALCPLLCRLSSYRSINLYVCSVSERDSVCVLMCGRIRENLLNNRAVYHIQCTVSKIPCLGNVLCCL